MVRLSDEDYSVLEIRASEMRLPVAMLARSILHRELVQELGAVLADVAADIPVAVPEAPPEEPEKLEQPEQSEKPRASRRGYVAPELLPGGSPTPEKIISSGGCADRRARKRRNKGRKGR
jgi:hypothetical protein